MSPEQVPPQLLAGQNRKQGKKRKGRRRAVPQRTCVGCRNVYPKREMMRIVRTPDDTVEIDPKRSGRGAYLCRRKSCWEQALRRRSLDHALKTSVDDATKAALAAYAQTFPEDSEPLTPVSGEESRRTIGRG